MSRRKDELRALLAGAATPAADAPPGEATPEAPAGAPSSDAPAAANRSPAPQRAGSGAVKAMGLALGSLRTGAEEARALRDSLARGEHVVELDPALIEPAFVADRLSRGGEGDESFEALKASIAEGGQEVPVLVRPHPDAEKAARGRYQAAYGHRRIAAARELGRKVRAIVRPLSDEQLVLAQGKENSERRDLSFIERALFAQALVARGFERRTVQAALGLHKAEMTRLLQVAELIPVAIAQAVGPAPRAGRTRWMELAGKLKGSAAIVKAQEEVASERFRAAGSDERFALVLARVSPRGGASAGGRVVQAADGAALARLRRSGTAATLEIAERAFADYVADELPALHAAFLAARNGAARNGNGDP